MFDHDGVRRRGRECLACLLRPARTRRRRNWPGRIGAIVTLAAGTMAWQATGQPPMHEAVWPNRPPAVTVTPTGPKTTTIDLTDTAVAVPESGAAYWLASSDGGVFSFGAAAYVGGPPGAALRAPLVALAATPSAKGYWVAAADGGVFAYGDAPFKGSTGGVALKGRVVGIAATPSGQGYWLVGSDGGVFAFGDAGYYGSVGGMQLNQRIVGMAPTPSGHGYWLAGADGGVFAFGDATYWGTASQAVLKKGIVSIAATASGRGYWLAGADGGIFSFGDAPYFGSMGQTQLDDVVGMSPTASGHGYWLVGRDGGVFSFGDADFYGAVSDLNLNAPIVGMAARVAPLPSTGPSRRVPKPPSVPGPLGYDISWPQCGSALPGGPFAFGIIGVTGGRAMSGNACLTDEWRWAKATTNRAGLYINVSYPGSDQWPASASGLSGNCAPGDLGCQLYNFGANTAVDAVQYARQSGVSAPMYWLDVETANPWPGDVGANARVVAGAIDQLHALGLKVGIYSTPYQWASIVGGFQPGLPVWTAGASGLGDVPGYCDGRGFGGGAPYLVQLLPQGYDADYLCPPGLAAEGTTFG